jgi:hypothetical protein
MRYLVATLENPDSGMRVTSVSLVAFVPNVPYNASVINILQARNFDDETEERASPEPPVTGLSVV